MKIINIYEKYKIKKIKIIIIFKQFKILIYKYTKHIYLWCYFKQKIFILK